VLGDYIDAVARGPGEHGGQPLRAVPQRLDRIARVIVELAAVGAVETIIEVVPPVSLAPGAAHHRGEADGRGADDVATRLSDDADPLGQPGQSRAQRCAEAADVLHGLGVIDGKAPADVESVERSELLPAR